MAGGRTLLGDLVREFRPRPPSFELRFETPAGRQAQVDFAYFEVAFDDAPEQRHIVWLFSLVLGHRRYLWARFFLHQDLAVSCAAHGGLRASGRGAGRDSVRPDEDGGVRRGQDEPTSSTTRSCWRWPTTTASSHGPVARTEPNQRQSRTALSLHPPGLLPGRALSQPRRPECPAQHWLDTVANVRVHGTTQRVVAEHFAEERPSPDGRPRWPSMRRSDSSGGSATTAWCRWAEPYSVPDGTRKRVVEVQMSPDPGTLLRGRTLIAVHPLLEGRHQRSLLRGTAARSERRSGNGRGAVIRSPRRASAWPAGP